MKYLRKNKCGLKFISGSVGPLVIFFLQVFKKYVLLTFNFMSGQKKWDLAMKL